MKKLALVMAMIFFVAVSFGQNKTDAPKTQTKPAAKTEQVKPATEAQTATPAKDVKKEGTVPPKGKKETKKVTKEVAKPAEKPKTDAVKAEPKKTEEKKK